MLLNLYIFKFILSSLQQLLNFHSNIFISVLYIPPSAMLSCKRQEQCILITLFIVVVTSGISIRPSTVRSTVLSVLPSHFLQYEDIILARTHLNLRERGRI